MAHKIQIFQQGFQKKITLQAEKGDGVLWCGCNSSHVLQRLEPPLLPGSEHVTSANCWQPSTCPEDSGPSHGPGEGTGCRRLSPHLRPNPPVSLELSRTKPSPPACRPRLRAEAPGCWPPGVSQQMPLGDTTWANADPMSHHPALPRNLGRSRGRSEMPARTPHPNETQVHCLA